MMLTFARCIKWEFNSDSILNQRKNPSWSLSAYWGHLCRKGHEPTNHLFLHCEFTGVFWSRILTHFDIFWVMPKDICSLFSIYPFGSRRIRKSIFLNLVVAALFLVIWIERNNSIFNNVARDHLHIWDHFLYFIYLWYWKVTVLEICCQIGQLSCYYH